MTRARELHARARKLDMEGADCARYRAALVVSTLRVITNIAAAAVCSSPARRERDLQRAREGLSVALAIMMTLDDGELANAKTLCQAREVGRRIAALLHMDVIDRPGSSGWRDAPDAFEIDAGKMPRSDGAGDDERPPDRIPIDRVLSAIAATARAHEGPPPGDPDPGLVAPRTRLGRRGQKG